jgi:ankyrin repeat protein
MGHAYSHGIAKDHSRVHYGDNFYNYNKSPRQSCDELALRQDGNQSGQDAVEEALKSLAFAQMEARRETISTTYSNTCEWFFEKSEYLGWRNPAMMPDHFGFFWIKSKPGAGKSTLMKFLLRSAEKQLPEDQVVSFFFNARGETLEKSLEGLYRSLLHQILTKFPRLQELLRASLGTGSQPQAWSIESLKAMFTNAIMNLDQDHLTCLIDALDECPEAEIRDLIDFFEELGEAVTDNKIEFRVCFSSRHYPHVTMDKCQHMLLDGQEGHEQDIAKYVKSKLKVRKDKIGENFRDAVQNKAQGVFMWVVLVVRILNEEKDRGCNIAGLRKCLDLIPNELHKLFEDILQRGVRDDPNLVPILQWVSFARRPLACEELYFAVRSDQADFDTAKPWDPDEDDSETMKLFILNSSKGLAELTRGKSPTVQFIHESVRDYLRETGFRVLAPNLHGNLLSSTHEYLKRCCGQWMTENVIKHLALPYIPPRAKSQDARETRTKAGALFPFLEYSVSNLIYHADSANDHGQSQASFIEAFPLSQWVTINNIFAIHDTRRYWPPTDDLSCILVDKSASGLLALELQLPRYHAAPADVIQGSLRRALTSKNLAALAMILRSQNSLRVYHKTLLLAIKNKHTETLRMFLVHHVSERSDQRNVLLNEAHQTGDWEVVGIVLQWVGPDQASTALVRHQRLYVEAVERGEMAMVRMLSKLPLQVLEHLVSDFPRCMLSKAASLGNEDIVRTLLAHWVHLDKAVLGVVLFELCQKGLVACMRILLEYGADINKKYTRDRTPLFEACTRGHTAVVQALIECGANVDQRCDDRSPLFEACTRGYDAIVRVLLEHGAGINSQSYGATPLLVACIGGHGATVPILLEHGAKIDPQSSDGVSCSGENGAVAPAGAETSPQSDCRTAAFVACVGDFGSLVQELIEHGVDWHTVVDTTGYSPLMQASEYGYVSIVQKLLDAKQYDSNPYNVFLEELLCLVCSKGQLACVSLLLAKGTNPNATDRSKRTILSLACLGRYDSVVRMLLSHGADVNPEGEHWRSPLIQACFGGSKSVLQVLLAQSIRTNFRSASLKPAHHEASSEGMGIFMREVLGNGGHGRPVSEELVLWLSNLRLDEWESIANELANGDVSDACNSPTKGLLFMTSMHGFHMVQNLLQNGAEFSAEEHFHALSVASQRGHGLAVKALIANEPRSAVRLANDYGEVVQAAAAGRHAYVLEILLDRSENFRAQSRDTFTEALRQATQLGFDEIVRILRRVGVTLPEDGE